MYLKNEVLKAINTKENRRKIATALNVGEMGIVQAINRNPPHSSLTKLAALECISELLKKDIKELLK